MDGVFVIDKPPQWTSHDVVNKMRRIAGTRRVGHLGTLDPMATGVLPLVVGRATRLAQFYSKSDKVYDGVIRFGHATTTYDAEGEPMSEDTPYEARPELIEPLLNRFRGTFAQTPPPVSAKKVGGQPAYKLARKNIEVKLEPVEVTVHSLALTSCSGAEIGVTVHCSSGTYLRAIAHELGRLAGMGACLQQLRRTRAGDFTLEQARTLEQLQAMAAEGRLMEALVPGAQLLPQFPAEVVDDLTAGQIRQGRDFRVSPFRVTKGTRFVKAVSQSGELVAIGEATLPNIYHPAIVL